MRINSELFHTKKNLQQPNWDNNNIYIVIGAMDLYFYSFTMSGDKSYALIVLEIITD